MAASTAARKFPAATRHAKSGLAPLVAFAIVAHRMFDFRRKQAVMGVVVTMGIFGLSLAGTNFASAEPTPRPKKSSRTAAAKPAASATPVTDLIVPPAPSPAATATSAPPEAPPLTAEQMAASVTLDTLTVPTPGEVFAAINKQCKPNWTSQFRGPLTTAYSDRAQAALNLGGLIADGYIAVEAMDGQQVKNLGRDILALAKNLGISKGILDRGESINRFSEDNDWRALKEELEAMQNEVKQEMDALHDDELITLLSLGAWIRGTYVVSDVVLKNYSDNTACILRQPALVDYLHGKLDKLSPRVKDSALIKTVSTGLDGLGKLVSFPLGETASREDVQKLHDQSGELLKVIAKKD